MQQDELPNPPHQIDASFDDREVAEFRIWFLEQIILPICVSLFSARGVQICTHTCQAIAKNRHGSMEFDLICADAGNKVAAVDVNRSINMDDVTLFVSKLSDFHCFFDRYYPHQELYGILCGVMMSDRVASFGMEQGLFIINSASEIHPLQIINAPTFIPRVWRPVPDYK